MADFAIVTATEKLRAALQVWDDLEPLIPWSKIEDVRKWLHMLELRVEDSHAKWEMGEQEQEGKDWLAESRGLAFKLEKWIDELMMGLELEILYQKRRRWKRNNNISDSKRGDNYRRVVLESDKFSMGKVVQKVRERCCGFRGTQRFSAHDQVVSFNDIHQQMGNFLGTWPFSLRATLLADRDRDRDRDRRRRTESESEDNNNYMGKSWEMFVNSAFPQSSAALAGVDPAFRALFFVPCPEELQPIAGEFVRRFQGHPHLSLEQAGDVVSTVAPNPTEWLGALCTMDPSFPASTYSNLSSCSVRSCFLYLAHIPAIDTEEIEASKLISLWIAEGLIPTTIRKVDPHFNIYDDGMEDTARVYLKELVDRFMVEAVTMGPDGNALTCRLGSSHFHNLCVQKAKENMIIGSPRSLLSLFLNRSLTALSVDFFGGGELLRSVRVVDLVGVKGLTKLPDDIKHMISIRYQGLIKGLLKVN